MPTVSELTVVVNADTSKAESGISSFSSGMGHALGLGVAAASGAIAAAVGVGIKAAGDLEQSVANISTIQPDVDTSKLFSTLNEMQTRIPQSASQLGEAYYNVVSSFSTSTEGALSLVETFAKGAVGAQTDAQTFGTSILGVMNAYGLSAEDATHVSDVFFNTVAAGVVTGQELASSLGPVTQSAKAAGVSVDELGGLIAGVTKEGGPAAQNINNLNNFLQKITTKEARGQLKALGIATTDATGAFRPTTDVLTDLKAKLGGMTEAARANALQAIFPDAQARQGAQTLLDQLDFVKTAIDTNKTEAGSAEAAFQKMNATFNSQMTLLQGSLMSVLTTVGAALLPVITPLVTAFSQWLPGAFKAASDALAPFGLIVKGVIETLGGLENTDALQIGLEHLFGQDSPLVGGVMDFALAIRDQLLPGILALGSAFTGLFAIFSGDTSLDTLATTAESLLTFFGLDATTTIMQFAATAGDAFRAVADFALQYFGTIVSWVQDNWPLIQATVATILANIAQLWDAHGASVIRVVQDAWTIVTTVIMGALDIVLSALKIGMQLITGDWSGAWDTLVGVAGRTFDRLGIIVGTAFDAIDTIVNDATGGAITKVEVWMTKTGSAITDGWQAANDAISGAWDAITSTVQGAIDAVSSALEGAWSAIGSAVQGAWDDFTSTIKGALDAIQTAISTVWNQIPQDIRDDLELIARTLIEKGEAWVTTVTTTGANMLTAITEKLTAMVTAVTTWVADFLSPITGLVTTATTEATNVGTGMLTSLSTQFSAIVTAVTTWVADFLAPVTGLISTATSAAESIGQGILTSIQTKLDAVITAVTTWGGSIVSSISGLAGSVGSAAASIGQGIVDGIVGAINAGLAAIRGAAYTAARSALDAAKSALGVGGGNGADIPGYATGGVVWSKQLAWVGENGPELITPLSQMNRPSQMGAGAVGGTIINLDLRGAQVYDGSKFEDLVVRALDKAHRGGRVAKVTL